MKAASQARLAEVDLPEFGMPDAMPELPAGLYADRLARLRERCDAAGVRSPRELTDHAWLDHRAALGQGLLGRRHPRHRHAVLHDEDRGGIALADASLRAAFAGTYPGAWARVKARRAYMTDVLGIELHPDMLPLSNIPAFLPPFLLRPDHAMALGGKSCRDRFHGTPGCRPSSGRYEGVAAGRRAL